MLLENGAHILFATHYRFAAHADMNGKWVTEKAKIRKHYMRTWFVPDALSSLPIQLINILMPGADSHSSVSSVFDWS
eukprot:367777-Prymnesium_polylepis.1